MSSHIAINASVEIFISETSSPEPRCVFPFQPESLVPEYDNEEKDDELF